MILSTLLLLGDALAQDVLVPELTPTLVGDLPEAEKLTASVVQAANNAGFDLADPEILVGRAGVGAIGCAENLACPGNLWMRFPQARLAIVGLVGAQTEGYAILIRYYAWNQSRPIDELSLTLAPGAELGVGQRVVERAAELLRTIPPAAGPQPLPAPAPTPAPAQEPPPPRVVIIAPPEPAPEPAPELGLPPWDQARFEESGLSAAEFSERERVRTGHLSVELYGGAAFGDLDRYYSTRVAFSEDSGEREQTGTYQYATMRNGSGASFGLTLAYAPVAWAEPTLSVGLQLSHQEQVVGYEVTESGERVDSDRVVFVPGRSMLGLVEPGLRFLPIASGAFKPYALAGLNLRFFPGYGESEVGGVDYPSLPGGVALGPTLGLGLAMEAAGRGRGFVEIPWTLVLLPLAVAEGAGALTSVPDEPLGVGQMLTFKAGVGLQF